VNNIAAFCILRIRFYLGDAARGLGTMVSRFIDGLTIKEDVAPSYTTAGLHVFWQKTTTPVSVARWCRRTCGAMRAADPAE
jgi:hypothetical protein